MDPKFFLKATLVPIFTNLKWERAPKKRNFFVKIFQKSLKTPFWLLFSNFCLRCKNFGAKTDLLLLWEARKINSVDLKKKQVDKVSKFFENPSPLEKTLDPPLYNGICFLKNSGRKFYPKRDNFGFFYSIKKYDESMG